MSRSTTTTTSTYTLLKYSRSYGPVSGESQQQNEQEWQHFTNPVIRLTADVKKTLAGELESFKICIIWSLNSGHDGMDVDQRDVVFEDLDLLKFSSIPAASGAQGLPLKAVYRDAVVGVRYLHPRTIPVGASPSYRRFQITFQSTSDASSLIDLIKYVCPCKVNPASQAPSRGVTRTGTMLPPTRPTQLPPVSTLISHTQNAVPVTPIRIQRANLNDKTEPSRPSVQSSSYDIPNNVDIQLPRIATPVLPSLSDPCSQGGVGSGVDHAYTAMPNANNAPLETSWQVHTPHPAHSRPSSVLPPSSVLANSSSRSSADTSSTGTRPSQPIHQSHPVYQDHVSSSLPSSSPSRSLSDSFLMPPPPPLPPPGLLHNSSAQIADRTIETLQQKATKKKAVTGRQAEVAIASEGFDSLYNLSRDDLEQLVAHVVREEGFANLLKTVDSMWAVKGFLGRM